MTQVSTALKEANAIKTALESFPEGASIEDIIQKAGLDYLPRRTLQRRLAKLREIGKIEVKGKTRGVRYFLAKTIEALPTESTENRIPLSNDGKDVLQVVKQPLQKRSPVGYNPLFINNYQPNKDSYLSGTEIDKLTQLGQMVAPSQPAGTYARDLLNRLLIDLSWNSSRMEGNTYSLLDTQRLISFGQAADGKSTTEAQMILNHKDAIEFLVESVDDIGFNRYTLLNLHAMLSNNLLPDPQASGRLRSIAVGIHHSVYEPPAVPQMILEVFDVMLKKCVEIENPFEQAFFMMVHLPYLQPFDDVNKRVSRLAANIPLVRHNLSPLSFVDVPNDLYVQGMLGVYELNRIELLKDVFMWAYERSAARYAALQQSLGEPDAFRLKYRETLRELISDIVTQTMSHQLASKQIQVAAKSLPLNEQSRFIEAVETELLALHEGNFARYQIRPSEFHTWTRIWKQS